MLKEIGQKAAQGFVRGQGVTTEDIVFKELNECRICLCDEVYQRPKCQRGINKN